MTLYATVAVTSLYVRCGYADTPAMAASDTCQRGAVFAVRKVAFEGDWYWRCTAHQQWWSLGVPVGEQSQTIELPRATGRLSGLPEMAIISTREVVDDEPIELSIPMTVPTIEEVEAELDVLLAKRTPAEVENDNAITGGREVARAAARAAAMNLSQLDRVLSDLRSDGIYDVEVAEGMPHAAFHLQAAQAHTDALLRDIERLLT